MDTDYAVPRTVEPMVAARRVCTLADYAALARRIADAGGDTFRLRPPDGIKDWNEALLLLGLASFRRYLDESLAG